MELIKCAGIINEAYGLQILISTTSSIINIIILLYNLYATFLANVLDYWILNIFAHFYWIFCFVFQIFMICNICETTMTEVFFPFNNSYYIFSFSIEMHNNLFFFSFLFSLFPYMPPTPETFFMNYTNLRTARNFWMKSVTILNNFLYRNVY